MRLEARLREVGLEMEMGSAGHGRGDRLRSRGGARPEEEQRGRGPTGLEMWVCSHCRGLQGVCRAFGRAGWGGAGAGAGAGAGPPYPPSLPPSLPPTCLSGSHPRGILRNWSLMCPQWTESSLPQQRAESSSQRFSSARPRPEHGRPMLLEERKEVSAEALLCSLKNLPRELAPSER